MYKNINRNKILIGKRLNSRSYIRYVLTNEVKFKAKFPQKLSEPSQLILLRRKHGVRSFPVNLSRLKKQSLYLWVATKKNIKTVIEYNKSFYFLSKKIAKHTNLTGGKTAFIGGQIKVSNNNTIAMDFASGRYGPKSKNEFDFWYEKINIIFKNIGYNISIEDWDDDAACPCRIDG